MINLVPYLPKAGLDTTHLFPPPRRRLDTALSVLIALGDLLRELPDPSATGGSLTSQYETPAAATGAPSSSSNARNNADESFDLQQEAVLYHLECEPGIVIGHSFELITLLGEGQSSRVWLARDLRTPLLNRTAKRQSAFDDHFSRLSDGDDGFCAVKVFRADDDMIDSVKYESELLSYINDKIDEAAAVPEHKDVFANNKSDDPMRSLCCCVSRMIGRPFLFCDANTKRVHPIIAFKRLGPSLDRFMQLYDFHGIANILALKDIVRSTTMALDTLAALYVIHSDLKPENLLFTKPWKGEPDDDNDDDYTAAGRDPDSVTDDYTVTITDFGLSYLVPLELREPARAGAAPLPLSSREEYLLTTGCYAQGSLIQTREYRSPEIILGLNFTCAIDVWSLGCMTYELITGRMLFDPKIRPSAVDEFWMDALHLQEIAAVVGPPPLELLTAGEGLYISNYFQLGMDDHGDVVATFLYPELEDDKSYLVPHLLDDICDKLGHSEGELAFDFVEKCLRWEGKDRATPDELLRHPWLQTVRR